MEMRGKYFFLSNFAPCTIRVTINDKELIFSSVEAAFQAHKNKELAEKFILLKPLEAKKYGKKIPLTTPNWDIERVYVMAKLLILKFRDPDLFLKLKKIEGEIVEDNYWGDTYWGRCKGVGENMLGKLLMCIRDTNNDYNKVIEFAEKELIRNFSEKIEKIN